MSDPNRQITQGEWQKLCDDLRGFIKQKEAENKKLKEFARWVIREGWDGDICGSDIQDKGVEFGLLVLETVTAEDLKLDKNGENPLLEYYDNDDIGEAPIHHFTDILEEK